MKFFIDTGDDDPVLWTTGVDAAELYGARVYAQSMPRTFDINIRLSESSFILLALPAWGELMRMPLEQRAASGDRRRSAARSGPLQPHRRTRRQLRHRRQADQFWRRKSAHPAN